MTNQDKQDPNILGYHWPSYYLSRFNFVLVHIFTVFYWFPFLLNNPLKFPWVISTLDATSVLPKEQCQSIIWDNVYLDIGLWLVWWGQHSIMAREKYKRLVGLWNHPLERPLFGSFSCVSLTIFTLFWKPISNCDRTEFSDIAAIPLRHLILHGTVVLLAVAFVLSYFWLLPEHVFGTQAYKLYKEKPKHDIILSYPYGVVRHPAAASFLWLFWFFPSYTTNHIFYAVLWSIFILVGTLFEEGGLKNAGDFGRRYQKYKSKVSAYIPRIGFFTGQKISLDDD